MGSQFYTKRITLAAAALFLLVLFVLSVWSAVYYCRQYFYMQDENLETLGSLSLNNIYYLAVFSGAISAFSCIIMLVVYFQIPPSDSAVRKALLEEGGFQGTKQNYDAMNEWLSRWDNYQVNVQKAKTRFQQFQSIFKPAPPKPVQQVVEPPAYGQQLGDPGAVAYLNPVVVNA